MCDGHGRCTAAWPGELTAPRLLHVVGEGLCITVSAGRPLRVAKTTDDPQTLPARG